MFPNSGLIILMICSLVKLTISMSEEEIRYRTEKLGDLIDMVSLPQNANTVIVGHFASFSADLRVNIHNFYTSCANLDVPEKIILTELDQPIIKAILAWTQDPSKDEAPIQQALINGIKGCENNFINSPDAPQRKMGGVYIPFGNVDEYCPLPLSTIETLTYPTASGPTATGATATGPTPMYPTQSVQGFMTPGPFGPTGQTPMYPTQSSQTYMSPGPTGAIPMRPGPAGPMPMGSMPSGSTTDSTRMHTTPLEKKYIWDVNQRLRRLIPTGICARLLIVETTLRRRSLKAMNYPFLKNFHGYLIGAVEHYDSSQKSEADDINLHSAVFTAFVELLNWSTSKFRETEKLKQIYKGVEAPNLSYLNPGYRIYIQRLPSSGLPSFERTWRILKKILIFPEDTDSVILGNLEYLPESALDLIHDLFYSCFQRALQSNVISALQESLSYAIVQYKANHSKAILLEALHNVNFLHRLKYNIEPDSSSTPIYDKIEHKTACRYEPDYDIDPKYLDNKTSLSQIHAIISLLPPECCVRINIFKACSNKIYNEAGKIHYETQVINAIKMYATNKDDNYLRTTIIQIQHTMINQFELHFYENWQRKNNPQAGESMNVDQPTFTQPSQESTPSMAIVPVVSVQSPTSFRERSSFKRKEKQPVSGRGSGVAMFRRSRSPAVGDLYHEAVSSPRARDDINNIDEPLNGSISLSNLKGIRIEEPSEDVSMLTSEQPAEQPAEQLRAEQPRVEQPPAGERTQGERRNYLPDFVYSGILVVTLNLDLVTRGAIKEMYACFAVDNVAKNADYLLSDAQNRLSEAMWAYKDGLIAVDLQTTIINETSGCKKFVSRNQAFRNRVGAEFDVPLYAPDVAGTKRSADTPATSGQSDTGRSKRTRV